MADFLRRLRERWQPLERRLPLLITVLLVAALAAISWSAYAAARRSLLSAAGNRVVTVAQRLADALAEPEARYRRDGLPLARDPAVVGALLHPDAAHFAAASTRMEQEQGISAQTALIELWTPGGTRVLAVGSTAIMAAGVPAPTRASLEASLVGPLVVVNDSVLFEFHLPVTGPAGDTIGIVRSFNRLSVASSGGLVRDLIGSEAVTWFGNADGSVWTDLRVPVARPPLDLRTANRGAAIEFRGAHDERWIGAVANVPRVPWQMVVALPQSAVLGPLDPLLLRLIFSAAIVIAIGALGAWLLTRVLIGPLSDVTLAAEVIATGDYSHRVAVRRHDEVGRLAHAFNAMAGEIQRAAVDLESQQAELESQKHELEDSNEELVRNVAIARGALSQLEELHARTTSVIAGALDCVISMDHRGCITEFNPAAERTFGYSAESVIGKEVAEVIVPPALRDAHRAGLQRYLSTGEGRLVGARVEITAMRSDGSEMPVEIAITRLPVAGSPTFTAFIRDLSASKQLEAQLQQSQKMEAVGSLAGGVAHDFNNILTVIVSYGELLLSDPSLPPELRNDVLEVRAAAERATALTRQLLAFSRKQVLRPTVVRMNDVVADMYGMLSRVIREDIRLELRLGEDVGAIRVDRGQLEQVLMNLAVNARDAMSGRGILRIETSNVDLGPHAGPALADGIVGPQVVLTVSDTGSGMDATTRARLFEPFYTTKELGKGTGLGLSTVYGIVRQSGGIITVESEPGRGSTFHVFFPRHAGAAAQPEVVAPRVPARAPSGARVLLVEDEPPVRHAIRVMLERLGYAVTEASDASAGLALVRGSATPFSVVLTDAVMPGVSGLELASLLSIEYPDLPTIIMSGYAEEAVSGSAEQPSHSVFLEKPLTAETLAQALRRAITTDHASHHGTHPLR